MPKVTLKVSRVGRINGKMHIELEGDVVSVSAAEAERMIVKGQAEKAPVTARKTRKSK